jgi:hypothetical protein
MFNSQNKTISFHPRQAQISPTLQSSGYQQPHLTTVNQSQREAKHLLSPLLLLNVWRFTSTPSILIDSECLATGIDVFEMNCCVLSNSHVATVQAKSMLHNSYPEADSSSAGQQISAFNETLKFITVFTTSVTCLYLQPFQNPLILTLFDIF